MANYLLAQPFTIRYEGGYVNDPDDIGGETYRGISRNNFPRWTGWSIVDNNKPLHRGQIIDNDALDNMVDDLYRAHFWESAHLDDVKDQKVASYFYDFHVNAGANATKRLQKIVSVVPDGICGSGTVAAANGYKGDLLTELHNARMDYYRTIGVGNNAKFLAGWLDRARELYNNLKNSL